MYSSLVLVAVYFLNFYYVYKMYIRNNKHSDSESDIIQSFRRCAVNLALSAKISDSLTYLVCLRPLLHVPG